ncbi:MAG: hypothetical protein KAS29_00805, partial [Bacteroidales bacterium]|nr:hypothetical protein [Bacteroidales bacterium]
YDLFWNMENLELNDYREVVSIKEDGKVEITLNGQSEILNSARLPERPEGEAPQLAVELITDHGNASSTIKARATVTEGSAPVYYTQGADKVGIYKNTYVLWELYGPEEEDYTDFWNDRWDVFVSENTDSAIIEINFKIDNPGNYHLRVSTADVAGRSAIVWKEINVAE